MTNSLLPLAGLNIVVTRPREQAARLAQEIERLGGTCIQLPLLEISPLADDAPLRGLIARLHDFQLAIFISPNAVRYGMVAINKAGGLPHSLQIAAVGLSSALALQDYGVTRVIAPLRGSNSEALLELAELQEVKGKKVAIFRGDSGRELLADTLKLRGATVEYVTCYHRSKPRYKISELRLSSPDALSVSSSEALQNLWEMLDASDISWITALPLFVSHERIATAAHKLGWRNIIPSNGDDHGLISALTAWATQRKGKQS